MHSLSPGAECSVEDSGVLSIQGPRDPSRAPVVVALYILCNRTSARHHARIARSISLSVGVSFFSLAPVKLRKRCGRHYEVVADVHGTTTPLTTRAMNRACDFRSLTMTPLALVWHNFVGAQIEAAASLDASARCCSLPARSFASRKSFSSSSTVFCFAIVW